MFPENPSHDDLWIVGWIVANVPFLFAGGVAAVVRILTLYRENGTLNAQNLAEAALVAICVCVAQPLLEAYGLGTGWAMGAGVAAGLFGLDAVRAAVSSLARYVADKTDGGGR